MIDQSILEPLAKGDDAAVADRISRMSPFEQVDAMLAIARGSSAARGVIERLARGEIDLEGAQEELKKLGPVTLAAARNIIAKEAA